MSTDPGSRTALAASRAEARCDELLGLGSEPVPHCASLTPIKGSHRGAACSTLGVDATAGAGVQPQQ